MANPRQRRKTKSSAHKAISHSKRAKRILRKMPAIRGPKALQDAWDSSKTVRQNYLAMGLQYDLNPISSGGSEVTLVRVTDKTDEGQLHPITEDSVSEQASVTSALPKGFGRIIRDSSGNIVRVELPNDEEEVEASQPESVMDAPMMMKESELRIWADGCPEIRQSSGSGGIQATVVQDLENLAASATVQQRHTSEGERLYLERLVRKYGNDLQKMTRDRRLNPEQRTANELKRAIVKAGGFGVLCNTVVGIAE